MEFTETLKKTRQFRYVFNKGKSAANKYLVMCVLKNKSHFNRLGIQVSKKVGKSVIRSRVTRLIRESYRLSEKNIVIGYDIVVIARIPANGAAYVDINSALISLLKRHKLYILKEGAL